MSTGSEAKNGAVLPAPVKLQDILDALELQSDEASCYLDKRTREVVSFSDEELGAAERGGPLDDYPAWQVDVIAIAKGVQNHPDDYLELPSRFDIDEYRIMKDFCLTVADKRLRERLFDAIRGRGAFRRFKAVVRRHGLADDWYRFREGALKRIAVDWCVINGIAFVET